MKLQCIHCYSYFEGSKNGKWLCEECRKLDMFKESSGGRGGLYTGYNPQPKRRTTIFQVESAKKPKTLLEQALDLLGLKDGDEFYFAGTRFKVISSGIWLIKNKYTMVQQDRVLVDMLKYGKECVVKYEKSEAELILDELEKVVDKVNEVLRRNGR